MKLDKELMYETLKFIEDHEDLYVLKKDIISAVSKVYMDKRIYVDAYLIKLIVLASIDGLLSHLDDLTKTNLSEYRLTLKGYDWIEQYEQSQTITVVNSGDTPIVVENVEPNNKITLKAQEEALLLDWLPSHSSGLSLHHNPHKVFDYTEDENATVEDFIASHLWTGGPWVNEEEKQKAIDTNSLWQLQWTHTNSDDQTIRTKLLASSLEALREYFLNKGE